MENDVPVVGPDALTANFKMNKLNTATARRDRPILLARYPRVVEVVSHDRLQRTALSLLTSPIIKVCNPLHLASFPSARSEFLHAAQRGPTIVSGSIFSATS